VEKKAIFIGQFSAMDVGDVAVRRAANHDDTQAAHAGSSGGDWHNGDACTPPAAAI
jgi:hypothetical protein